MVHRLNPWRTVVEAAQPWRRRAAAIAVMLAVVIAHGCVADQVSDAMLDLMVQDEMPQRMEVTFVREMEQSMPVPGTAAIAKARPVKKASDRKARAVHAASAPEALVAKASNEPPAPEMAASESAADRPDAAASEPAAIDLAFAPTAAPSASSPTSSATSNATSNAAASAAEPNFDWPASTRLTYVLTGNYQGEIHGTAQVQWVRLGNHYQVHMDVTVGLSLFPLMSRKMTSDGELTPQGLMPRSYDEDSKVAGRDRRRSTIRFEPDAIWLPDGRRRERWPGVQDAASQFVQMSYLFTIKPELLTQGNTIEIPLALPRNVDWWLYDVLDTETLYTPFGTVDAVHLKPRRVARKGGDLTAEIWFAPSLAYLPARIRIQQDASTFIDLMLKRKPQLAAQ